MRNTLILIFSILLCARAAADAGSPELSGLTAPSTKGELQIRIQSPSADFVAVDGETTVEVDGVASSIGGVQHLDMIFVMDTSMSLQRTDPDDFRSSGAIGLVRNLSPKSDIEIGVVSFDSRGELTQPLTSARDRVIDALRDLPRSGNTNLAAGITAALEELKTNGRPGSSRVIMLFTDGKSNEKKAYEAAVRSHGEGVVIQALLLGSDRTGTSILDHVAWATGGSFVQVSDPTMLPDAFLNLRTTGVDSVRLSVNGSEPVPAQLAGGTFSGRVPLAVGENRIVAAATSLDGQTRESVVTVTVQDASCAALEVAAKNDGRPVVSLNDRAVEIIVDASRSMWGRMQGEPKMAIAKDILEDVSHWFPDNLDLALRAYGSTSPSESSNCADSALLVPFGDGNREPIRQAIAGLSPLGQTPIAYALNQAAADFASQAGDRAVVLVTDGIESCGGDPAEAARELGAQGIPVHLIGFGMGNAADEDAASLRAIASASGGRYVTAGSAEELKDALARTVATSFSVYRGGTEIANGSLGSGEQILLPKGQYRVEVDSVPPREMQVSLAPRDSLTLTLERRGEDVSYSERRDMLGYRSCVDVLARIERLERGAEAAAPVPVATH
jgi:Mg-chelatase subunit ChlD